MPRRRPRSPCSDDARARPTPPPVVPPPPAPAPIAHPTAGGAEHLLRLPQRGQRQAGDDRGRSGRTSVHGQSGVTCADCHGGDPTSDQMARRDGPGQRVHRAADRVADRRHVRQLPLRPRPDEPVRACRPTSTPSTGPASTASGSRPRTTRGSRSAPTATASTTSRRPPTRPPRSTRSTCPTLCASCHADAAQMAAVRHPDRPVRDLLARASTAWRCSQNEDVRAPSCASCHGSHDAQPPTAATVVEVCGKCHTATQDAVRAEPPLPSCGRGTQVLDVPRHARRVAADVGRCSSTPRRPTTTARPATTSQTHELRIELDRFANDADRRCDTCHHPDSDIYAQVQGIDEALSARQTAYDDAECQDRARRPASGMIVTDAEVHAVGGEDEPHPGAGGRPHDEADASRRPAEEAEGQGRSSGRDWPRASSTRASSGARRWWSSSRLIVLNVAALYLIKRMVEQRRRGR